MQDSTFSYRNNPGVSQQDPLHPGSLPPIESLHGRPLKRIPAQWVPICALNCPGKMFMKLGSPLNLFQSMASMPQTLSHILALSGGFVTIFHTGARSQKADTLWPFSWICRCCPSCLFRCLCILSVVDAFLVLCLMWVNILYPMCIQQIFFSATIKVFFFFFFFLVFITSIFL